MFSIWNKSLGQRLILPFYHAVSDEPPTHLRSLYHVRTMKQFEADIDFLLRHYQPLSIHQLHQHIQQKTQPSKPSFFLSFDDGLREFKDNAWPVLKRKGVPVALFVNSAFVDNKELFYRFKAALLIEELAKGTLDVDAATLKAVSYHERSALDDYAAAAGLNFASYLQKVRPYLTVEELRDLCAEGVVIGAHSVDHPHFYQLSLDDALQQLSLSMQFVQHTFKTKQNIFSFPFTDWGVSKVFFERMYAAGIDLSFGTAGVKKEKEGRHLQRIPVEDHKQNMLVILLKQYLYYLVKAPLGKNTIRRL